MWRELSVSHTAWGTGRGTWALCVKLPEPGRRKETPEPAHVALSPKGGDGAEGGPTSSRCSRAQTIGRERARMLGAGAVRLGGQKSLTGQSSSVGEVSGKLDGSGRPQAGSGKPCQNHKQLLLLWRWF